MLIYVLYFCVFLGVAFGFELAAMSYLGGRERSRTINRRLQLLEELPEGETVLEALWRERSLGADSTSQVVFQALKSLWIQSGMRWQPLQFLGVTTLVAVGLTFAATVFVSKLEFLVLIFVVATGGVPFVVLTRKKKKRAAAFTRQLPNALDIVVRSLNAGHPVPRAIDLVAREMADPAGTEFGIVSDELTYGLSIEDAMVQLYNRVGAEDLRLLATTISVQRSTGGNLGEILYNLSSVIRERFQMRAKIKALSSEGRVTAYMMAAFPFIMYGALSAIVPNYFDPFWQSPFVAPVLIGCGLLMLIGNFILFRMVNFDF